MALTPFTFLLRYSFPSQNPHFRLQFSSLILLKSGPFSSSLICRSISGGRSIRSFSTLPSTLSQPDPSPPKCSDPKSTLSARMSFVFDQIEAIERERSGKDEALQRIRSWREQKQNIISPDSQSGLPGSSESTPETSEKKKDNIFATKEVELVHPWPEWIELMERLLQQNYFDHRRNEEDQMLLDNSSDGVGLSGFVEEGFDFTRDWITVRNACINFGRDRFDILRSLSRKDIQILVGHGCPSTDTKVVFSAKVLRKHAHLDEGDVCSSCSLRSSCSRAFLLTRKEDEARTLDIMRVLLSFGFEPVSGSVENKPVLKLKSVKTVVRKLLHEVVKLSAVPIDPNLPPPVIKKPPPKVKQPPPPPKRRVGRDDIEMKKGDWLCPKCDFMNFAKNTVCLQCDAKRPKRQLLPGEWECPECNFLNYRRNMVCFHCEHKRPPDEFMETQTQAKPRGPRTRLERAASIPGVSGAWNFDFDDNESDGADVAAFEFADPPRMGEDSPWDGQDYKANSRGFEDDSCDNIRAQEDQERGRYSACNRMKPSSPVHGTGFDDFDEEDDVDNYELEIPNKNSKQDTSSMNSSGVGGLSEFEDSDQSSDTHLRTNTRTRNKPSRSVQGRASFSGSDDDGQEFDSDSELSAHPSLKSSHIADSRHRTRGRGGSGPCRGLSFGSDSDDDLGMNSDFDEDEDEEDMGLTSRQAKGRKQTLNRKGFRRENSDSEDGHLFSSESDDDDRPRSQKNKMRGNNAGQREEEDMGLTSRQARGRKQTSKRKGFRRENSDSEDGHLFGSESDDDDRPRFQKNKMRGNNAGPKRRGSTFEGQDRSGSGRDSRFRVNDMMGDRRKHFPDVDRDGSFGNSRRYGRGSQGDGFGYGADERSNKFSGRSERTKNFDGRSNKFSGRSERTRNFDGRSNEFSGRSERTRNFDGRSNEFSGRSERTRNFDGRSNKFSGRSERTRNFDGRSNKFSGSSERTRNFVDDKPHRRIIER